MVTELQVHPSWLQDEMLHVSDHPQNRDELTINAAKPAMIGKR